MARRPSPPPLRDQRDVKIDRLQQDLWIARQAVGELLQAKHVEWLDWWLDCNSFNDLHAWQEWVIDRVIEEAEAAAKPPSWSMGSPTARCPLCGSRPQSPYSDGFAIPIGLARHLDGSHGSRQCSVVAVYRSAALEHVRDMESGARKPLNGPNFTPRVPPWAGAKHPQTPANREDRASRGCSPERPSRL